MLTKRIEWNTMSTHSKVFAKTIIDRQRGQITCFCSCELFVFLMVNFYRKDIKEHKEGLFHAVESNIAQSKNCGSVGFSTYDSLAKS